jgi:hypothetical protein
MAITNTKNESGYRISSTRGHKILNCFGVVRRCKIMTTDIRMEHSQPSHTHTHIVSSWHFPQEIIGRKKYVLDFVVVTN